MVVMVHVDRLHICYAFPEEVNIARVYWSKGYNKGRKSHIHCVGGDSKNSEVMKLMLYLQRRSHKLYATMFIYKLKNNYNFNFRVIFW